MRHAVHLGELEQHVLWAIVRLRDNAYGVTIADELEERTGRRLSFGALYTTLDRLQRKGLVKSRLGDPTAERGGRAKRYVSITAAGADALERSRESWRRVWHGLKPLPAARRECIGG